MKGIYIQMSRKDYEAIAVEINSQVNLHKDSKHRLIVEAALFGVAQAMALRFANDNPRFNYSKFMVACGMRSA